MDLAHTSASNSPVVTLVDDDAHLREAMSDLLDSVGIDTVAFASANEFINAKASDRPGCLVLDVRMPGLSGLDLQAHLSRNGINTPIVFLTGHGDIAMGVEAMKAGAQDFLTKPVRQQTFLDAISKAIATDLARRQTREAAQEHVRLYQTLTPRERQVFLLVVQGALNKQIAYELGVAEVTIKLHRSNVMKKMKATTFHQLFCAWQCVSAECSDE